MTDASLPLTGIRVIEFCEVKRLIASADVVVENYDTQASAVRQPPPALGGHTEEVLAELERS